MQGYCVTIGNLYNQMLPRFWRKKAVFLVSLHFEPSLHFVPKVCILYSVCSLHFLLTVWPRHPVVWPVSITRLPVNANLSWMNQTPPPLNLPLKADIKSTIPTQNTTNCKGTPQRTCFTYHNNLSKRENSKRIVIVSLWNQHLIIFKDLLQR